ncbi:hypothetical protein AWJ20_4225 [Sugiyamaella lignohabitans]|uniref:UDENN FLCN/SMCR8-type domain-containing protein n=1 Tax=Sugiyamaella lignohabitans TaxID=796027 RepID=A0A167CA34_9ASCO|nr:uncharacterized protein AWJ20_4225 [Sugiyamaella lignohabitans]ANB11415.1 hypothetical protein AWJ20_4225 [Sugiyamaella lignohabitans]
MHGPTSIMCTQALSSGHARAEIKYHNVSRTQAVQPSTCKSCEFLVPLASASSQVSTPGGSTRSDLSGIDPTPHAPPASAISDSTASGTNSSTTRPACVKTEIKPRTASFGGLVCVSSHYPASQARYTAIRQTCLRMLSSEHTFNDSTPMLFSDPSIGSAIILVFMVQDEQSRGLVRRYGITCVSEDETLLVEAWNIVAPQIENISKSIQKRAALQSQKHVVSASYSGGPERYLRKRDTNQPARSLCTIVNDDELFLEIHAKFSRILSELQSTI